MSALRLEFFGDFVAGALPRMPLAATTLRISRTATAVADQPTVPAAEDNRGDVFLKVTADRATYVLVANRPDPTEISSGILVVPGQFIVIRAFPGQRIAAASADDVGTYSQAEVDALVAAASAGAVTGTAPQNSASGGTSPPAPANNNALHSTFAAFGLLGAATN